MKRTYDNTERKCWLLSRDSPPQRDNDGVPHAPEPSSGARSLRRDPLRPLVLEAILEERAEAEGRVVAPQAHLDVDAAERRACRDSGEEWRRLAGNADDAVGEQPPLQQQHVPALEVHLHGRLLVLHHAPPPGGRRCRREVLETRRGAEGDGAEPALLPRHVGVPRHVVARSVAQPQDGAEGPLAREAERAALRALPLPVRALLLQAAT
mmetsp:Transcript_15483/g.51522  ORF Transcript_15483/g.51522 Transcript_15483/m.51522 type:complete len:209 (-) Transcript_15483:73-699(-)